MRGFIVADVTKECS